MGKEKKNESNHDVNNYVLYSICIGYNIIGITLTVSTVLWQRK